MKTKKVLAVVLAVLMLLSAAPLLASAVNLPTPQNVKVSGGDESITIQWDPINDFNARKDLYYFRVLYSTDKTNWLLAGTSPRDSAMDVESKPEEGAFVPGTTYYFAVQSVSWNEEFGPISEPSAGIKYTSTTGELRAEWEAIMAGYKKPTTEKGTKYDKVQLVKNEKLVWDNGLYTLTVLVSAVSKTKATLKITMQNKTAAAFECHYISWVGATNAESGEGISIHEGTQAVSLDLDKFCDGANYLTFSVTGYGNPVAKYNSVSQNGEYSEYADKLIYLGRKHTLYFQKAPQAPYINFQGANLKVTSNAISFGAGYKTNAKSAKGSGTILYYKTADAKKWSKKTFAAGKTIKITKLQPDTDYQIRTMNYVKSLSAADNKTVVTSKSGYSNTKKLHTGLSAAPEIKSIKVSSKIVTVHHNAEWWYNGVKWIYKEAYDSKQTNYTVTVTLKNIPKNMKALECTGLGGINTQSQDVKKNGVFTFTGTAGAGEKGKSHTFTFLSYTNKLDTSWYVGSSPSVKKSVTL